MNKKVALISDIHFGIKQNNNLFFESQINYFKNEFIPYLEKNNITTIAILGDLFDNRNSINVKIQNVVFELFKDDLQKYKIYIIIGNHDIYYTSTVQINSVKILSTFSNVTIIDKTSEIKVFDTNILMVPWQVDNGDFIKYVANNNINSKIVFGHFQIIGFYFNKTRLNSDGLNTQVLKNNFDYVFSGHFHIRSKQQINKTDIVYIGSPYELNRNDTETEKGFCVLNLENNEYEFINNKHSIKFIQLKYPQKFTKEMINNNIIDVQVKYDSEYDENKFQAYINLIESYNPLDSINIDVYNNMLNDDNNKLQIKNSYDMIYDYIQTLNINNKNEIFNIITELYNESKNEI